MTSPTQPPPRPALHSPASPSPADGSPAAQTDVLRAQVGRLLNRAEPISEAELAEAQCCLAQILDHSQPVLHASRRPGPWPAALGPLTLLVMEEARRGGDCGAADVLQAVYYELALGDGDGPARTASAAEVAGNTTAGPAPDATLGLRARLGRMLGRRGPVPESELHLANLALVAVLDSGDPVRHAAEHWSDFPPAFYPLLLSHLAQAWAGADTQMATVLEAVHRAGAASAATSPAGPSSPAA
jgi:hypothetical protein